MAEWKDEFFDLTAYPVGARLQRYLRRIPELVSARHLTPHCSYFRLVADLFVCCLAGQVLTVGQGGLYDSLRANVLGVRTVHVQPSASLLLTATINGLDIGPFLPPLVLPND